MTDSSTAGASDIAPTLTLADLLTASAASPGQLAALRSHAGHTERTLAHMRERVAKLALPDSLRLVALGSYGRGEAHACSDLDLACIDTAEPGAGREDLVDLRERVSGALRELGLEVSNKTFHNVVPLASLLRDIGGPHDSNASLTYRALLLTESAALSSASATDALHTRLFSAYAESLRTRGRFLSLLANDLHRYYRTICVDYRFKVEEADKSWALRVFKLRCTRKCWHLGNIALQLWATSSLETSDERDRALRTHLRDPSLVKIALPLVDTGPPADLDPLLVAFARYLELVASPDHRRALEALSWHDRQRDPLWAECESIADDIDRATQSISARLWDAHRELLVRFFVL